MYEYKVCLSDKKIRVLFKVEDIIVYRKASGIDELRWNIEKEYPDKHWRIVDKRII